MYCTESLVNRQPLGVSDTGGLNPTTVGAIKGAQLTVSHGCSTVMCASMRDFGWRSDGICVFVRVCDFAAQLLSVCERNFCAQHGSISGLI